jgi:hypothetical protein
MAFTVALVAASPTHARTFATAASSSGQLCTDAIDAAGRNAAIPVRLLAAIGRVESGRFDPQSRTWRPWPWTIDVNGQGYFFNSKPAAIAAVRALEAQGIRSIDVGCMQVNLQQHPNAFASLDDAFDPRNNARYASQFLNQLFVQSGSWQKAAARYHSSTPAIGIPYGEKVMALLSEAVVLTPEERLAREQNLQRKELATAWAATLDPAEGNALSFARAPETAREPSDATSEVAELPSQMAAESQLDAEIRHARKVSRASVRSRAAQHGRTIAAARRQ